MGTGTMARTPALRSFSVSSSRIRRTERARERTLRITPCPVHRGQMMAVVSSREGRRRCRDISMRPKREIRPTCTRARSASKASRMRFSTAR